MKGIICAGGLGTRLYPLTYATNKHLLPVYNQPMIYYPIQTLVNAGITEILIVTGGPHAGHFIRVLKNVKELGIRHLDYVFQEKEDGIVGALKLGEDFAKGDNVALLLGDNVIDIDLSRYVNKFSSGATIFLSKVSDPQRHGVPEFDEHMQIIKIVEKPKLPASNYAVRGLYLYDNSVFDIAGKIFPSARGELEITDVNNTYISKKKLNWEEPHGFWEDAGTFDSLLKTSNYWAEKNKLSL